MHKTTKWAALIFTVSFSLVTLPLEAQAKSDYGKYQGVLPDAYYDQLALCETNSNWQHSTRSYTGGLGIYRGTFKRWSNYSSAKGLTPKEQVAVADAIAFKSHIQRNGIKVWRVGPWGWGCLKMRKSLQAFICKSPKQIVQRWKRNC
jgi:hypothetical protein